MACFRRVLCLPAKSFFRQVRAPTKRLPNFHEETRGINSLSTQFSLAESTENGQGSLARVNNQDLESLPIKLGSNIPEENSMNKSSSISEIQTIEELLGKTNLTSQDAINILLKIKSAYFLLRNMNRSHEMTVIIEKLANNPSLLQLWEKLEKGLPNANLKEIYTAFHVYLLMKLPVNSTIFKKIMKLLLDNFNHLSPLKVLSIYKEVMEMDDKELYVKSLQLASLYYMDHCFDQKRRPNEPLSSIIYFAKKRCIPLKIRKKLLNDALSTDMEMLSETKNIINLGVALSKPDVLDTYNRNASAITSYCNTLRSSINSSWVHHDVRTAVKIHSLLVVTNRVNYSPHFYDRIAILATENNFPTMTCVSIAKNMLIVPHLNYSILKKVIKEVLVLDENRPSSISASSVFNIFVVLGTVDCRTICDVNWNYYREKLHSILDNSHELNDIRSVYVALNAAVMGIYNNNLITKAVNLVNYKWRIMLKGRNQENAPGKTKRYRSEEWGILLLYQCLVLMHPSYCGTLPKKDILDICFQTLKNLHVKTQWSDIIETVCGGKKYVLERCTTYMYHLLSHVVILDENNTPVDLSEYEILREKDSNYLKIENVEPEPNHRILIFVEFPLESRMYFRNVDRIVGFGVLYVRTLEAMGFNVVTLNSATPSELERVPYLKSEIEKVCGPINLPSASETA